MDNTKMIASWLAPNRKAYQEQFAGKNLGARPKLNGKVMCQRFHSKGYCFDNCFIKASHVPSKDLDDKTQLAYLDYCKLSHSD